jgi:hypothetical protein
MADETKLPTISQMRKQLFAAGWTEHLPTMWISPQGYWYLGPAGAWKIMNKLDRIATQLERK